MIEIDFTQYKNPKDVLEKTGLTPKECIKIIDAQIDKLFKNR